MAYFMRADVGTRTGNTGIDGAATVVAFHSTTGRRMPDRQDMNVDTARALANVGCKQVVIVSIRVDLTVSAYCAGKAALNHFTQVLAAEETTLTALAVRPGVVDTEMQAVLRREGSKAMTASQVAYYHQLKDRGALEPPEIPARSIAWLALYAPPEFSGRFLDYDDPRILRPALEVFGEILG